MAPDDRTRYALHEAGHAVANVRFGFGCESLGIQPDAWHCKSGPMQPQHEWDAETRDRRMVVRLAGYAATIILGRLDDSGARAFAGADLDRARRDLRAQHDGADDVEAELDAQLDQALVFVSEARNRLAIAALAQELLKRTTLDGAEVEAIIARADGQPLQPRG
ncbi:MAG: hypothetical protein HY898_22825 [Deltaproteobacteria bacterium]|nr:hypothetical protein [Deltaproteobacteria bacterium]